MSLAFKGSAGVGKTCLIVQLISGKFVETYDPTLEDSYRRQITVGDKEIVLDIFDTAGQEDFSAVRDSYMTTGDGFIIAYSVVDQKSFDDVTAIHTRLTMLHEGASTAGVVVGNKCDLPDQVVQESDARALADSLKWGFVLASAKSKINILETFQEVSLQILSKKGNADALTNPNGVNSPSQSSSAGSLATPRRRGCILF